MAALLLFSPILFADFVYDDLVLLRDNPAISNWSILWESFTRPMWELVEDQRTHTGGFFRPLGTISFSILWHLGDGTAFPFHLASWLLNALCAGLVGSLALALIGTTRTGMLAGLLFAVHGAHAEPVAWASSLTYLLACSFSLLSLRAMLASRFSWCAIWVFCAMLSQESAAGTWLLCLAAMLWKDQRLQAIRERFINYLPLLGALALVWVLRTNAFDSVYAGLDRRITWFGLELRQHPVLEELALSMQMLADYLRFLVWPWPHAPFHPLAVDVGIFDAQRFVPAICGLLSAACAMFIWLRRGNRSGSILIGLGLMFIALAPVMKTSSLGQFPFEERFLYLPSAGFAIFLVGLVPRRFTAILIVFVTANIASTATTIGHWKNEQSLFSWARDASPNAMMSWNESGRILLTEAQTLPGGDIRRLKMAAQAEQFFARGLDLNPDKWFISAIDRHNGNVGLANAILVSGDVQTAKSTFEKIVERWPSSAEANSGLGFCLVSIAEQELELGMETEAFGKLTKAIDYFAVTLEQTPYVLEVVYGKGLSLFLLERFEESVPLLKKAFEQNQADQRYAFYLASAYFELQQLHLAQQTWERFLESSPSGDNHKDVEATITYLKELQKNG